ncbi:MAG: hypothetical protein JEY96_19990 [Bacteroidales bacterium]|nr:hypothetical protein [Bacteroidales bacterium]
MSSFYHITDLDNYPVHHIWGDQNGYFILLGRTGNTSYTLTISEIKKGNWLFSRLLNENQTNLLFTSNHLQNAPKPFSYPSDMVFYKSENAICISRPVPVTIAINDWANMILEYEPIDHFILASIMITLFLNRNKNVLKNQMLAGINPQDYYAQKVDHLKFCLEQKRRIEDFGI